MADVCHGRWRGGALAGFLLGAAVGVFLCLLKGMPFGDEATAWDYLTVVPGAGLVGALAGGLGMAALAGLLSVLVINFARLFAGRSERTS